MTDSSGRHTSGTARDEESRPAPDADHKPDSPSDLRKPSGASLSRARCASSWTTSAPTSRPR